MKKYRQTRITVKTREIISVSRNAANETASDVQNHVCPLCRSPLVLPLDAKSISAAETAEHDCPKTENK